MTRTIQVLDIDIPAMSTIGYGRGIDVETNETVRFVGDHRPMRVIFEEIEMAFDGSPIIEVEVEEHQVIGVN